MMVYSVSAAAMYLYGIILLQLMSPMLAATTKTTTKVEITSSVTQEETTASVTQTSTPTTTVTTTTTVAPELGANCTSKNSSWCNDAISGEAVCHDGDCVCNDTYVKMNSTACIPVSDLTPVLNVTAVNTSTIEVSWTLQESVSNLAVAYAVTAVAANGTNGVNCTVTEATKTSVCSSLSSGYKYNITVTANYTTTDGRTLEGQSSVQEVTKPSTPGSLNISASNLNTPNVTLIWIHSEGRVDKYTVNVTASVNVDTVDYKPEIVIAGLVPGMDYNVTITSNSYNRSSDEKQDWFRTISTVPGSPLSLNVSSITNSSLKINWTETNQPNGDIEGHQVCIKHKLYNDEAFSEPVCYNTTASVYMYEADNLTAGTWYEFDVFTINDMYISSTSINASQRTNEAVPMDVEELSATPMNVSIRVTWQRPKQPHGDIIMYRVEWSHVDNADQICTVYLSSASNNSMANNCSHNITDPSTIVVNQKNMTYIIDGLESHATYKIKVTAYTSVGAGTIASIQMQTTIAVPEPVTDVIVEVNATAVRVSWSIPAMNPGPVNYTVSTKDVIDGKVTGQTCSTQGYNSSSCVVSGLEEFWLYRFNVVAETEAGTSNAVESHNITTDEAMPGQISDHSFELYNATTDCDATKVTVHWTEPALRDRNSNITHYLFQKSGKESPFLFSVPDPNPYNSVNRSFQKSMTRLEAETSHTWMIRAQSNSGTNGDATNISVTTGVCPPPSWNEVELQAITEVRSSPSSVTIALPYSFFEKEEQGRIQEKGFIVLPKDSLHYDNTTSIKFEDLNNWTTVSVGAFKKEYKIRIEGTVAAEFEIGIDSQCNTDVVVQNFCNGPLPEQFSFKIAAYGCTKLASTYCRYSEPHGPFATQKKPVPPPTPGGEVWIIAVAVLFVIGALVGAFALLWYRKVIDPKTCLYRPAPGDPFSPLDRIDRNRPIVISNFASVLENMHRDTNLLLSDQYDDINRLGEQIVDAATKETAKLDSNTPKNRWVNILPFDHSRVKLQQIDDDDPTSDYINANYMPGFNSKREYIATQGPLPGTIDDFWRMVWEHNVNVIVMLTQCKEGSRVKCEKYWPDELREPKQYGDVVVNPVSISQLDKYNITIFSVTVNNQSRKVIHFHYLDFPDFSANVEFDHFIKFVISVRHHVPHDMVGPMVTHCSAGVGRTGTFIAIDRLNLYLNSDKFDENDEVDIFGIVVSLRENRVAMVQTESQYIMIHDCFEKMLEDKKKSMQMTDSEENLYENQGFDPYPEVVYENVSATQQQTEL